MKQKFSRWLHIATAVVRKYLALDMAVYAGSATLFLLMASFPMLMWVLVLVNLLPGFSVESPRAMPKRPSFQRPIATSSSAPGTARTHSARVRLQCQPVPESSAKPPRPRKSASSSSHFPFCRSIGL